jgi:hypothetical protein
MLARVRACPLSPLSFSLTAEECVCWRAREREGDREGDRERERLMEREGEKEGERYVEYVQNCYFYF